MTTINSAHQITAAERYAFALTNDLMDSLGNGQSVTITNTAAGTQVTSGSTTRQQPADIVSFSPQASSVIKGEQIALAIMNTAGHAMVTAALKASAATATADPATVIAQTIAAVTAKAGPTTSPVSSDFKTQYAAEAAAGPGGRFYNSTTPEDLSSIMSDKEYASFKEAFDNRTLTIQSAAFVKGTELVAQLRDHRALGKSRTGHARSLGRNLADRLRMQAHGSPP